MWEMNTISCSGDSANCAIYSGDGRPVTFRASKSFVYGVICRGYRRDGRSVTWMTGLPSFQGKVRWRQPGRNRVRRFVWKKIADSGRSKEGRANTTRSSAQLLYRLFPAAERTHID